MAGARHSTLHAMERLSVEDAARRLGISVSTVRRRIRDGMLTVEQEATPQGFRYWVLFTGESSGTSAAAAPESATVAELEVVRAERDWLRARVEELTALLNREQEAVLRLTASQRLAIEPPPSTPAPTHSDQARDRPPPRRRSRWWRRLWAVLRG